MSDEKRFHCTECGGNFVLVGGTLVEHVIAGRVCSGSGTVPKMGVWLKPPAVSDSDREIAASLNSAVSEVFVSWSKALDEDLKDVVRRAIKLVEENPRNEPMRTELSRPAVESMLIQDLDRSQLGHSTLTDAGRAELAKELFDAGWRPTIDRVVR